MKLHLGCSDTRMLEHPEDWTNVDIRSDVGADVVADLSRDNPFPPDCASDIYCSHLLEHLDQGSAYQLVMRMADWLVAGGTLWLAVPDFPALAAHYIAGRYGGQIYGGIAGHGTHRSHWTRAHLAAVLEYFGFEILAEGFVPMSASFGGSPDASAGLSIRLVCRRNGSAGKTVVPDLLTVHGRVPDDEHVRRDVDEFHRWFRE